ncbi:phage antirepressor N-terminal domain-containing protein [Morganella morganii]|uniref:phage antirepressor N-terminal domain-containing protein n=1 Tax=Morganella morganii TaxID=582 RepID=UPI001BDA3CA0|nr:phage antirepressor N-terminal domain-containing protein [Morganella morganii]EJD6109721.1 phage antirepressor N-terminal domain-containing protein [Morganella morganii]EKU4014336.1 phage antirepressor N-terminal domain-containing protein [Morganella morganii]ELA7703348.1 phage antirepressor N-terminal domain-containing protein [Morganella morganii]MBT0504653.1 phage antirepressor N-terminal domain-containing protein [Morganella morganii subsp. morganii]MDW7787209.1 phage antirepressor N-te
MNSISTINVPFHGDNLYVVNYNGQPYVPMKPVVEGMGLTWQSQFEKLKQRFSKGITEIVIPSKGGDQSMLCLALRKLAGWLHTISPNKVKPEIRDKVIRYQEECDDVLYEYWTTGEVKKKPSFRQSTAKELIPLRQTAERLIAHGVGNIYPDIWKHVHAEFGVQHINELLPEQIPLAISYLDALEGEYIPKQGEIAVQHDFNFPLSWWNQYKVALKARGIDGFSHKEPCFFPYRLLYGDICESPSAISNLLSALTEAGYDVSAARLEHRAHRHYAERSLQSLRKLNDVVSPFIDGGLRMQISAPIPADWR